MEYDILERILDGKEKPTNLPFALLKKITQDFSEEREIGHGGFGTVYKGVLRNGNVAVKRIMNNHTIDEKLFYREVDSLLKVNHKNVVRFIGFCANTEQVAMKIEGKREYIYAEVRERLFCFEYISNGNLQNYITDELRGLEWNVRYQIIKEICEGLYHLHMENHIIHMDLKPANILLDHHMVPKVTDFGLSRLDENSQTMSANRFLSLGYCAPEYLYGGRMSVKSDIYSLGVIIVELVTGHKSIPDNMNVLRRWRHRWKKSGKETPLGYQQVTKCIEIGLRCQENDPYRRPFIGDILRDIIEMEGTNEQISSTSGSTISEISPYLEDDMLGTEPLELHFPFELNKQISCSLHLINETDGYIAFNIETTSPLPYCTHPSKGIVPPRSKCSIDITLQPHKNAPHHAGGGLIVRSTKVSDGLSAGDVTTDMFNKEAGSVVDEVSVDVVFDGQLQAPRLSEGPKRLSPLPVAVLGTEVLYNREASNARQLSSHTGSEGTVSEVMPAGSSQLLDIHPHELRFNFEPNKLIPCSLHLTNNTDEHVPFKLMEKNRLMEKRKHFLSLPLYGIVPPRSTYTLIVKTDKRENLPEERDVEFVLQNSIGDERLKPFRNQYDCDRYFEKAKESGNVVHSVTLKVVYASQGETSCEATPPLLKVIFVEETHAAVCSIDANQTEPWIITGHYDGRVGLWDYDMQKFLGLIEVTATSGCLVKFIERCQWFLAGSYYEGFIHVYNYKTEVQKVNSFRAHDRFLESMDIHPTQPYVLSSSDTHIKLWDWEKDWECRRTFTEHSHTVKQVAFNPWNTNSFASASRDHTVKIWSLDSSRSMYTLSGHSDEVNCLDFFIRADKQYLITGSEDMTTKIWDMQKETCVETLNGFMFPVVSVVCHPSLPLVITGTRDGTVHFWSLTNFRLERILNIGCHQGVRGLATLTGPRRRVVIGHGSAVSMVEIHDEELIDSKGEMEVCMRGKDEYSI